MTSTAGTRSTTTDAQADVAGAVGHGTDSGCAEGAVGAGWAAVWSIGADLDGELWALEQQRRRIETQIAQVLASADRTDHHRIDGHGSVAAWTRANVRWSAAEARDRSRVARVAAAIPKVAAALESGGLGLAQAAELGRAFANPRCGDQLANVVSVFLEVADAVSHDDFCTLVRRWENLADVDGAHGRAERAYRRRNASLVHSVDGVHLEAHGPVVNGELMAEVLDRYCDAEWEADWEEAQARLGDDATPSDLQRTFGQRRFDALCRIFDRAAEFAPAGRAGEPMVNIHVDAETLADAADPEHATPLRPEDVLRRRCETSRGVPLAPTEALAAAIVGSVRRVVTASDGVVLDLGRRRRLFSGPARKAILDLAHHCVWPGCSVPSSRCQVDHLTEWRHEGKTDVANAAPLCGRHNRFKSTGFRVWRDPAGLWHTVRPDGTEIG